MSSFPSPTHGRAFRPEGDALTWDLRLLATLAILSELTAGQGDNMGALLGLAVELRIGAGKTKQEFLLKQVDVKRVCRDVTHPVEEDGVLREQAKKRQADYQDRKDTAKKAKKGDGPASMGEALDEIVMDDVNEGMGKVTLPE
jgi:hypothetical protein